MWAAPGTRIGGGALGMGAPCGRRQPGPRRMRRTARAGRARAMRGGGEVVAGGRRGFATDEREAACPATWRGRPCRHYPSRGEQTRHRCWPSHSPSPSAARRVRVRRLPTGPDLLPTASVARAPLPPRRAAAGPGTRTRPPARATPRRSTGDRRGAGGGASGRRRRRPAATGGGCPTLGRRRRAAPAPRSARPSARASAGRTAWRRSRRRRSAAPGACRPTRRARSP